MNKRTSGDQSIPARPLSGPAPTIRKRRSSRLFPGLIGAVFSACTGLVAAADEPMPDDLMDMSLEALMDIEVTSVSKKPEKRSEAAAAIFVVTNDDIRRWGVTNVPEALRRVPGLNVARIDAGFAL